MKKQSKSNTFNREIALNFKAIDDDKRQVELSFSSEEPYQRWFGPEILSHKDGAIDLTRLNEIGCLLFNHDRNKVIGRIDNAWVENGRGKALVTFDDDDESEKIYKKVKNKTLKGVSVGYKVDSWEEVNPGKVSSDGKFLGPCSIALKWMPHEISIVSIPADGTVGVGRDMEFPFSEQQREKADYSYYERQILLNQNLLGGSIK